MPLWIAAAWRAATSPLGRVVLIVAAVIGILAYVHHSGETAGAAKIEAKHDRAHAAAVAAARADTVTAANASTTIATSVAQQTVASAAVTHHVIQELHDAIDAVPPAPAGDPVPAAPVDGLRRSLNAAIARAGRAADAADALP